MGGRGRGRGRGSGGLGETATGGLLRPAGVIVRGAEMMMDSRSFLLGVME